MEVSTVDQLTCRFHTTLSVLTQGVTLTQGLTDPEYQEAANSLNVVLDGLTLKLCSLSRDVDTAKVQLDNLEELKSESQHLLQQLQFASANIPSQLPNRRCPVPSSVSMSSSAVSGVQLSQETSQALVSHCQYLDFLSVEEFEAVPKYIRGRLSYSKVNTVIEQLDKVYVEKYKIVRQKRAGLSDANRKLWEAYRLQENDESRGVPFIVDKDVSHFSALKLDAVMRNILTILRHTGLMHEIRGGGYVRYAAAPRY